MQRHSSSNSSTQVAVHQSPAAPRRPVEVAAIDMELIWKEQQVENAKWITIYAAILQGAMSGAFAAPPPKEGESDDIVLDYEALANEADQAYARFAARIRNQR